VRAALRRGCTGFVRALEANVGPSPSPTGVPLGTRRVSPGHVNGHGTTRYSEPERWKFDRRRGAGLSRRLRQNFSNDFAEEKSGQLTEPSTAWCSNRRAMLPSPLWSNCSWRCGTPQPN